MNSEFTQEDMNKFVFDMFNQRQQKMFLSFKKELFNDEDIEKLGIDSDKIDMFEEFLKNKFNNFFKFCIKQEKKSKTKKKERERCEYTVGSGPRKGEQCTKFVKEDSQFCGMHSKKVEKDEKDEKEKTKKNEKEKVKKNKKKENVRDLDTETDPLTDNDTSEINFDE